MIEFKRLKPSDLELVLKWRLKESVSKFLFTKIDNDLSKQIKWFEKVSAMESYKYWVINYNNKQIGVFNLHNLDLIKKTTNAGFYIGEDDYRNIGSLVPPYFYNYIFKELELNRIYGEVVDGNPILKIHQIHGYKVISSGYKEISQDYGTKLVHNVELLAEDWLSQKKYARCICNFE